MSYASVPTLDVEERRLELVDQWVRPGSAPSLAAEWEVGEGKARWDGSKAAPATCCRTRVPWRDVWAGFLFWAMVGAVVVCDVLYGRRGWDALKVAVPIGGGGAPLATAVGMAAGTAAMVTVAVTSLVLAVGGGLVKPGVVLSLVLLLAAAIGSYFIALAAGLVFTLLLLAMALLTWWSWHTLVIAERVLDAATAAVNAHPSLHAVTALFLVAQAGWVAAVCLAAVGVVQAVDGAWAVIVPFVLALLWGGAVWSSCAYFVAAAVTGRWMMAPAEKERRTVSVSLYRAVGPSFGSLSFGCLVWSGVETVRVVTSLARSQEERSQDCNVCVWCLLCCLEACLRCLSDIIARVNTLLFNVMALTGKSYCDAWSHMAHMLPTGSLWLTVFNDDWTIMALHAVTLASSMVAGIVAGGITHGVWALPASPSTGASAGVPAPAAVGVGVAAFLLTACLLTVACAPVRAGVTSVFLVCMDDLPAAMANQPHHAFRVCEAIDAVWGEWRSVQARRAGRGAGRAGPGAAGGHRAPASVTLSGRPPAV